MLFFTTMDASEILVWVQTTPDRKCLRRTIDSIEQSDIGQRFVVVTDHILPDEEHSPELFWEHAWCEMVDTAQLRNCRWLLRLEDDIEVNRYLLSNLCSWDAPEQPQFGLGRLADNLAHLVHIDLVQPLLAQKCPFDSAVRRLDLRCYVHEPALLRTHNDDSSVRLDWKRGDAPADALVGVFPTGRTPSPSPSPPAHSSHSQPPSPP